MIFAKLSSDAVLGICGCCLAVASASFGTYMIANGPNGGLFGNSHEFTVFAQLAPRRPPVDAKTSAPLTGDDSDLDMMATATIPRRPVAVTPATQLGLEDSGSEIIPTVVLQRADDDTATVAIGGRSRRIKVGDILPGVGEVLEIIGGARPSVRTARGLIVSARRY